MFCCKTLSKDSNNLFLHCRKNILAVLLLRYHTKVEIAAFKCFLRCFTAHSNCVSFSGKSFKLFYINQFYEFLEFVRLIAVEMPRNIFIENIFIMFWHTDVCQIQISIISTSQRGKEVYLRTGSTKNIEPVVCVLLHVINS